MTSRPGGPRGAGGPQSLPGRVPALRRLGKQAAEGYLPRHLLIVLMDKVADAPAQMELGAAEPIKLRRIG